MQAATDVASAAAKSMSSSASSLRNFARVGALIFGFAAGIVAGANKTGARESAFRAVIKEKDDEIAQLKQANEKLNMEKTGKTEKASSGDPVQDWIDSLAE